MVLRTIMGMLIVLAGYSCDQHASKSGLLVDNGINRGTSYTDASGEAYNLRYIPISITNDSTLSIQLEIAFYEEYRHHPDIETHETFRLLPLPEEWALNGVGVSDQMMKELPEYIARPVWNKTLEPGETCLLGIGALYPRPTENSGILPNALFVHGDIGNFSECEWNIEKEQSSNPTKTLGIKLNFAGKCMVIPCGHITYRE